MSLPLISFSVSLLGIIVMIWRKLVLFRQGTLEDIKHSHPFAIDFEKIKYFASKAGKKLRYGLLFIVLKSSIKASNFIKTKWVLLLDEIKNRVLKKTTVINADGITEKKEVSKYLKIISEYQQKIRNMKYRIKKEEGIE